MRENPPLHDWSSSAVSNRRCALLFVASLLGGFCIGMSACGSDTTEPLALISAQAYWKLQLDQHAVMLTLTAPTDTISLHATPLNAEGDPLSGLGVVRYYASDSTISVDSTGLVSANYTTVGSQVSFVVASLADTVHTQTLVDTCFFRVTATAPTSLATISIQPSIGDSATRALVTGVTLYSVQAIGTNRDSSKVTNFFVYFTSSDPTIATIDRLSGQVRALRTGHVTFYAQTLAYGIVALDSLHFDVTLPIAQTISLLPIALTGSSTVSLTFWPQIVTVGVGAVVTWSNSSYTDSADVVFDDPENVDSVQFSNVYPFFTGSGDIGSWAADTVGGSGLDSIALQTYIIHWNNESLGKRFYQLTYGGKYRLRRFSAAGTYHYHSARYGSAGSIVVR